MPELNYVYTPQEIIDLHDRALLIFARLCEDHDIPEAVLPGVYSSTLNMVAQTKAHAIAIPQR